MYISLEMITINIFIVFILAGKAANRTEATFDKLLTFKIRFRYLYLAQGKKSGEKYNNRRVIHTFQWRIYGGGGGVRGVRIPPPLMGQHPSPGTLPPRTLFITNVKLCT